MAKKKYSGIARKYLGRIARVCVPMLFLGGCSFAPTYYRPAQPTAQMYPRNNGKLLCTNVHEIAWQDFFLDPILQEIIEIALANNRDIRAAMHRMEESWAVYGVKRSDLYPHVDIVSDNLRTRIPPNVLPLTPSFILSAYVLSLSVTDWELDFWGRIRNLRDEALEKYLSSVEAQRAVCISLIDQVANSYLFACELNERIEIAKRTVVSRKETYDLFYARYQEGSTAKYEFIESETLLKQAQVDLASLERMRDHNWNALTLLVGCPIQRDNRTLSDIESTFVRQIEAGLPSELLFNRPDILAAEHLLKSAHYNIGAARAAFFPRISLTSFLGTASHSLKDLFQKGSFFWAFSPDVDQPLYDASYRAADLCRAKARRNLYVDAYEQTIQNAFREVADALSERTWYAEQVFFQREAFEAEKERNELAKLRFSQGSSSFLEVLDAEREKFEAEQDLVKSRRSLLSSSVNLYSALGGGICCN